ncbi:hypothetical protein BV22DRAFT_991291, partial [Leucogyrophana mollusca]
TNQRLGRIPLVIGMPIMLTHNFDVESGIVNGCTGILKSIRYTLDADGRRHATSCVIDASNTSGDALPHLDNQQVVALEGTVDL